jgi:hypothetical protein
MTNRVQTGAFTLMLAAALAGCSAGGPPLPTAPTFIEPPPTVAAVFWGVEDVTLSGVVYEVTAAGRVPIQGVRVFISDDFDMATDSEGAFSFSPVWACGPCPFSAPSDGKSTRAWINKDGYVDSPAHQADHFPAGVYQVYIKGDTRLDVELVRR